MIYNPERVAPNPVRGGACDGLDATALRLRTFLADGDSLIAKLNFPKHVSLTLTLPSPIGWERSNPKGCPRQ